MNGCNPVPVETGDVKVSDTRCVFVAGLESGVCLCLYDLTACFGGMTRFMRLGTNPESPTDTCWSDAAIHELFSEVRGLGSDPSNLLAKMVGCGDTMDIIRQEVSEATPAKVLRELKKWDMVVIAAKSPSGQYSLYFDSESGDVELQK